MTGLDLPLPAILHGIRLTEETHEPADKTGPILAEITIRVISNGVKTRYTEDEIGLTEVGKRVDSSAANGDAVVDTYASNIDNTDATTKDGRTAEVGIPGEVNKHSVQDIAR